MRDEMKLGYKRTKIGWIPVDWEVQKLKKCCAKIGSGITPKGGESTYLESGIAFIRSQNVQDGTFDATNIKYISEEQNKKMNSTSLLRNDILYNITGASIGRCCVFPDDIGAANVNQHVCIIRLFRGNSTPYFASVLISRIAQKQLFESQAGGAREGLNFSSLGAYAIPLPPLPEQKAIATVLDCWDKAIQKYEEKIEKKKSIKKGLMQKLLSGEQRLPGFEGEWLLTKTRKMFSIESKKVRVSDAEVLSATQDSGVVPRRILAGRVMSSSNESALYKVVLAGDFVISLRSFQGGIEYSAYNGAVSPAYTILRSQIELDSDYYRYYFKSNVFINQYLSKAVVGIRDGKQISIPIFMTIKLPQPPLPEQRAIASVLSSADSEINALEKKLSLFREQKRFLLNNLVTGQIRLPEFCGGEVS